MGITSDGRCDQCGAPSVNTAGCQYCATRALMQGGPEFVESLRASLADLRMRVEQLEYRAGGRYVASTLASKDTTDDIKWRLNELLRAAGKPSMS